MSAAFEIAEDWFLSPPKDLGDALTIINERMGFLNDDTVEGKALRKLYKRVTQEADQIAKKAREQNPFAFVRLSWEQALKCNAWIWGITLKVDFDANRIGKTATSIFDALLYMLPNDPTWLMFKDYTDEQGRLVHLYPRPEMSEMLRISNYLKEHPELKGDPLNQPYDLSNADKFATLQKKLHNAFEPCFPYPTFSEPEHSIWHGAPDADYHDKIIMKEWRKWLPKSVIVRDSAYDKTFNLTVKHEGGKTDWEIICKSYEAKDTKWSGAAVTGILLTEGLKEATLNEIKQRFKNDSFGYWDYTPYEARNVGIKTALAHKVFKGKVQLPLNPFVFSGFGIDKTPTFILPKEKRDDMIRMWTNTPEGEARIHGKFYTSSPVVLTNLDKQFHTLPWTRQELFNRYPSANLYRGLDPGYDHPTACAWGLLTPQNIWIIYRVYAKSGTSIPQRCQDIVEASGNERRKRAWGSGPEDYWYEEFHPNHKSEEIVATFTDHHTFKDDEVTKQSYALNYTKEGLVISRGVTTGPRERAQIFDRALQPDLLRAHPLKLRPPGCRIYFLINEEGVATALEKLENIFWDRYRTGDKIGEPKDQIQEHEDDEFDAISYLVCSPNRWQSLKNLRKEPQENSKRFSSVATLQQRHRAVSHFAITG